MTGLPTAEQAEQALRHRLTESRRRCHRRIPIQLIPVVKKLIRQGESKKKICILFGIDYQTLKSELKRTSYATPEPTGL